MLYTFLFSFTIMLTPVQFLESKVTTPAETPSPKLWTTDFLLGISSNFFLSASFYGVTPVLPLLLTQQGQEGNVGWVMGIFSVTMIAMRFLGGWLSDTRGRKRVALTALGILSSVTAAYIFAGQMGLLLLIVLRLCHGAVHGLSATCVGALVTDSIHKKRMGEGNSWSGAFGMASAAIMPFLALVLFQQSTFLWGISIFICAFLGFICIRLMRVIDDPEEKPFKFSDLVVKEKGVLLASLSVIGVSLVHGSITAYIPLYAKENHITLSVVGVFYVLYPVVILLSRMFVGKRLDQRGIFVFLYPSLFIIISGVILLTIIPNIYGLLGAAILVAGGVGCMNLTLYTYVTKNSPEKRVGAGGSTYYTFYEFGVLGGGLLAFVGNWIGFTHLWWFTLPFLVVTGCLIWKLRNVAF
jgi:MFS family permease